MEFLISKHQSQIIEYLCIPTLLLADYSQVDLTREERELISDIYADLETLKKLLDPYKDGISRYFLTRDIDNLMLALYRNILKEGKDPKTIQELYPLLLETSEDKLHDIFLDLISPDGETISTEEELRNFLEEDSISENQKWRVFWSYHHLKETLANMVALYKKIVPIYQPFYAKYEPEVDQMIEGLDILELYRDSPFDGVGFLEKTKKTKARVFVTSPLHLSNIFMNDEDAPDQPVYIQTYARAEHFVKGRQALQKDTLDIAIKALSDPIRYEILSIVSSTTLKNKEIAAQLGTTPANVSFHIQKLINAGLLNFSIDKKLSRYTLNKGFLKQCLEKISTDFDI